MAFVLPTISDFKAQFMRDFPYATPLSKTGVVQAEAEAVINAGGQVSAINVTTNGSGYSNTGNAPSVVIYGGGGVGARATATVTAGAVASIAVDKSGFGYTKIPLIYIATGGDNTDTEKVTDYDLVRAFVAAIQFNMSEALFSTQAAFIYAMNLLAAHYLCITLQASGTGLGGQAQWLTSSKTVGNVSETYNIPDRVLKSAYLAKLSKTTYGAQFLELVSPQLIGNFKSFHGITHP